MIVIFMLWIHFIADFVLQNDWMAKNKSENVCILLLHSIIYAIPFLLFGFTFAVVNGALHFLIDFITSWITKYYFMINDRHMFFVTIGFDQAMHLSFLYFTYAFLTGVNY